MLISNFQYLVIEETNVEEVSEVNAYSAEEFPKINRQILSKVNVYSAAEFPKINGQIVGISFYLTIENKTLFITQTEQTHIIELIDINKEIYNHSFYDDKWDELPTYFSPDNAKLLRELWFFSINSSFKAPLTTVPA